MVGGEGEPDPRPPEPSDAYRQGRRTFGMNHPTSRPNERGDNSSEPSGDSPNPRTGHYRRRSKPGDRPGWDESSEGSDKQEMPFFAAALFTLPCILLFGPVGIVVGPLFGYGIGLQIERWSKDV